MEALSPPPQYLKRQKTDRHSLEIPVDQDFIDSTGLNNIHLVPDDDTLEPSMTTAETI